MRNRGVETLWFITRGLCFAKRIVFLPRVWYTAL